MGLIVTVSNKLLFKGMGNTPFIYSPGQKTKERGKGKVGMARCLLICLCIITIACQFFFFTTETNFISLQHRLHVILIFLSFSGLKLAYNNLNKSGIHFLQKITPKETLFYLNIRIYSHKIALWIQFTEISGSSQQNYR